MRVRFPLFPLALVLVPLSSIAQERGAAVGPEFKLAKKGPEVKVDALPGIDFGAFKTFAWSETQEPAPNPVNHIRITRAVERELQAKGLKPSGTEPPDVRVSYVGQIEKKLKGTSHREDGRGPVADVKTVIDLSRVKEGTLIIELSEPATGRVLWRGVATETVAPADETEAQIDRAVGALVQRYPPKS
jgi:hypothetical protein